MINDPAALLCLWAMWVLFTCGKCLAVGPASAPSDFSWPTERFPILAWDQIAGRKEPAGTLAERLAGVKECGFTIAGWARPEELPACEQAGLKVIVIGSESMSPFSRQGWRGLSDEQIDTYIKGLAMATKANPAVVGYFIIDEPGTPAFPALAKAVAAVRRYAPGKLAYINLLPGYATIGAPDKSQLGAASFREYLERYVAEVRPQFLSYDNYMVQYSQDLRDLKRSAIYFNDLLEVRRVALEHGLPFWNIVSSNQIRPVSTPPSPANLLLQAWTTLAAGGRGVSWYTYYSGGYSYGPVAKDGVRNESWGYLRMVNEQLKVIGPAFNTLRSTGVGFTGPPVVEGLPGLPGRVIASVVGRISSADQAATTLPLMVGEFIAADGVDYACIVNLSLRDSACVSLTLQGGGSLELISSMDARPVPLNPDEPRWLTAGQGMLLRYAK